MLLIPVQSKKQRILGFVTCLLLGTFCMSLVRNFLFTLYSLCLCYEMCVSWSLLNDLQVNQRFTLCGTGRKIFAVRFTLFTAELQISCVLSHVNGIPTHYTCTDHYMLLDIVLYIQTQHSYHIHTWHRLENLTILHHVYVLQWLVMTCELIMILYLIIFLHP